MDHGRLLLVTGASLLKRQKRRKSSDDAATNGNAGASVLRNDVDWPDNVENDKQRETAAGN